MAFATVAITAFSGLLLAQGSSAGATGTTTTSINFDEPPSSSTVNSSSPSTTTTTSTTPTPIVGNPLRGVLDYLHTRKGVAQVALFNQATGKTYLVSDGKDLQYTASIVKADILAMWLRHYQSEPGTIPSNMPYSIQYLMKAMITMSDNVAATSLFYFGGGCADLTQFNTLIPTTDTKVGCETPTYYGWGNSTTSAADQTAIVRTLAYDNLVLTPTARNYGLQFMENVIPTQRWGVTCGPWGTTCDGPNYADPVPGVTVAVKNGWKYLPTCAAQDESCPWQVNGTGWVEGKGRNYVLAVLTTDDPAGKGNYGFDYGISTIQDVSKLVWENLAPGSER